MERSSTSTLLSLLQSPGLGAGAGGGGVAPPAGGVTVTTLLAFVLPPVPLQFRLKVVVAVSTPVLVVPEIALLPIQPPVAVQVVALVEDQDNVDALPDAIVVGDALSATVGGGVAVPPAPNSSAPASQAEP
jgi:hypothetical protein